MHVMDSVCRDAMLRHTTVSNKVEVDDSQDDGDSDVVIESKASQLVANDRPKQADVVDKDEVEDVKKGIDIEESSSQVKKVSEKGCSVAVSADSVKVEEAEKKESVEDKVDQTVKGIDDNAEDNKGKGVKDLDDTKRVSGEENKDCDKPKSSGEVEDLEMGNKEVPVDGGDAKQATAIETECETMEVDSRDSELVAGGAENELPKGKEVETEKVSVSTEQTVAKVEETKSHKRADSASEAQAEAVPIHVEELKKANEVAMESESVDKVEKAAKRRRSPSPVAAYSENEKSKDSSDAQLKKSKTDQIVEPLVVEQEKEPETPSTRGAKVLSSESAKEQLQRELDSNFGRHDRLLREYIIKSGADSAEAIQKHVDQLIVEIETLNDMIRAKEMEWNNMVHLKKVKEELVLRLTRKRHVQEIEAAPVEKTIAVAQVLSGSSLATTTELVSNGGHVFGGSNASNKAALQANKLIQNLQLSASSLTATSKTTQSILQNRANMTSEDLEKEKKNTAKLHRHSVQGSSVAQSATSSAVGNRRSSVSPAPNSAASGRASAPAIGSSGGVSAAMAAAAAARAVTPTGSSTPLLGMNSSSQQQQQQQINAAMAAFQALQQQQDLLNGQVHHHQQQQFHQQQRQQQEAVQQQHAAAVAAATAAANHAAGQMVGRQGAIKDVRSIIEDYRQRHPETVPRRGRRMKTVPTANSSDGGGGSLMMIMAAAAVGAAGEHSNPSNSNNDAIINSEDAVDMSGLDDSAATSPECGAEMLSDQIEVVRIGMKKNKEKGNNLIAGGEKSKANVSSREKEDRQSIKAMMPKASGGGATRRGSEWQLMLSSLANDSISVAPANVLSRRSSAESSHSSASATAINSILSQHGLMPAISVTSLGGGGCGGSREGESGSGGRGPGAGPPARGSMNVASHQGQPAHHHQQQQQQQQQQLHQAAQMQQLLQGTGNSLLHGILTKHSNSNNPANQQPLSARAMQQQAQQQQQPQQQNGAPNVSGFSPTLARLLTAPDRISTGANYQQGQQSQNPVMNLSKNLKSEITITPVVSQQNSQQQANQMYNMMMSMQDDEQDDNSADRLVIDEGIHSNNPGVGVGGGGNLMGDTTSHGIIHGQEFHENEVPECQGCKRKEAQFVCAGCGNQWYCSRECQVSAWDEHSETCTG